MKSYYYINEVGQQSGPITVESFLQKGITIETKIWCEGMNNWTKAGDVPELKSFFKRPPIPPSSPIPPIPEAQCPNNYLIFSILSTLLCCLPAGIAAIIYSTKVDKAWAEGNKNEAIKNSEQAKIWCIVSLGCGIISFIIAFICGFLGAL